MVIQEGDDMTNSVDKIYIDNDWYFSEEFNEKMATASPELSGMTKVRIPHTVKELDYHYFDESEYQMLSGYVRKLKAEKSWEGKTVLLTFEGIAHDSIVYVNGKEVGLHHCGYTAFTMDISEELNYGKDNYITVRCDSREDKMNIPPFGFVIDYMTYGGIYRDVYLEIKESSYISDCYLASRLSDRYVDPDAQKQVLKCRKSQLFSSVKVSNPVDGMKIVQYIKKKSDESYEKIGEYELSADSEQAELSFFTGDVELWDVENPALYDVKTVIEKDGNTVDVRVDSFGFRKAVFKERGFYLNGRKVKIRGLNRHQSYAYTGYAMPESMQRLDADILKNELGLNAVRTSHYPQAHSFIKRCDELGLLVFTEFPGWQHIGDDDWKAQAVENVKDMIIEYRNHPSIILWGVRINESVDDDELYTKTNELARSLDPYRQTGGVRCYKKGSFLEDVFTYNDFSHTGGNAGCERKADITPDTKRPYLVSEYNGHMYPTKAYDWEEHRQEHMLRHANVLDSVAGQQDIAGSFGWCMFDYNTHKDFGSGDRICYHGVMDMFRNPKLAAAVYAIQQEDTPVLKLSSTMDIGEHPGSNRGNIYILTNADSVKMYKNDIFLKEYTQEDSEWRNLAHGPILIDDYIGFALEENENMPPKQAADVKNLLNSAARYGLYKMPKLMYVKAMKMVLGYHMSMSDAVALYNKYIGDWGGASKSYRFEAYKDGELVKELTVSTVSGYGLTLEASSTVLKEDHTYDVAEVRIQAVDEFGNVLPFANDAVSFKTTGPIEVIGPSVTALSGGMGGVYVRTTGKKGKAALTVTDMKGKEYKTEFKVE